MKELFEHTGLMSARQFKAAVVHGSKRRTCGHYGDAHYQRDQVQYHQISYLAQYVHQGAVDRKYLHLCLPRFI